MSSSQINQEDASPDQHFYSPDSLLSSEKTESTLRRSGRLQGHLPPPDPSLITRAHSSAEVVQHANNDTEVNSHVHNNISDDPALKLPSTRNNDINDNDDLPHDNHVNDDHGEPPYAESMEEELQDAIPQHSQPSTISTTPGAQPHDLHLRLLRPRTSTTPDANVIADQPPPVLTSLPPRYSEHHVRQYQSSAVDNVPNNHKSYPAGTGLQHNHPQYHTRGAAMRDQAQGAEAAPRFGRGTLPLVDLTTTTTPTPNPNDAATVAALHAVTDALANITDRLMKLEEKSNAPSTLNVVDTAKNAISTHKTSIAPTNSVRISPVASATCLDSHDDNLYTDALTKAMLTASRIRPTPDSQLFTGASDKNVETFLHEITSDFRYILSDSNMKIALLLSSMSQPTIAHVTSLYTAKYGSITETVGIDADTFLSRLIEVLREAYTTSTAHMDARLSWESLLLQGHVSFVDFINKFQKLRTEVGALRGRIIEPAEALGRLWGCLPPSLRNWASDYLPPPAAQDLTERQLQYYITRLRNHCQHGSYHLVTTTTSTTTIGTPNSTTLATTTPTVPIHSTSPSTSSQPQVLLKNSNNNPQGSAITTRPSAPASQPQPRVQTNNCFRCGQSGHRATSCPAPQPLNHQRRCKRCGHSKHALAQCSRPTSVQCARCRRVGHLASICLQPHCTSQAEPSSQHDGLTSTSTAAPQVSPPTSTTSTSATQGTQLTDRAQQISSEAPLPQCYAECALTTSPSSQPDQALHVNNDHPIIATCPTTLTPVNSATPHPPTSRTTTNVDCHSLLQGSQIPEAPVLTMSTETQPGALYTDFNFLSHDSTPHKVRVMVDTGSSRSYISLKTVRHCLQQHLVHSYRRTTPLTILTANGATFSSVVQAQLILNTRHGPRPVWLHCAEHLINDILIGVDLLLDLDIMILMAKRQPLLRTQVGPLRDSIIKLIDTKNPKTTTKKPPTEIFSGVAADGELPVLQPVSSSSQAQTTSVSSPMPDHTTTTTTSTIHSINADTTVDPPPVQPAPTSSYDLANYVADYFTTIVAYTAVGNLATHDSVADSDPCPPPDVAVDTLTVVPQPDGSFKHYHRLPWKSTARPSTSLAGVQARTEAQLRRLSSHDRQHYDDCIQDLLQRGAIRRLQPTESPHWAMCHFGVRGHALSTTPLRPVFTGTQIGKFLLRPKGNVTINVINPLLLLRTNLHYHIEDLSKAFYSMYVFADEELWLCFWYRRAWHCFTKCPMGIAPSTGFLATSIETILTDLQRHHYARPIPTITHVDDITQVFRSKEEREDTHDLNVKHFGNHNFHMNSPKRITDDSRRERALGVWIDENDAITLYSIPPLGNFDSTDYDPVKGRRPSWPADDVDLGNGNAPSEPLTVQQAFSYVCGCYDPLGLAAETTTRQRILLRQTLALGLTNNDIVPTEISAQLLQCRRHLCNMKPQPRYVTPYLDANSNPIYFACVDASSQAVGLTITARGHDRVIAHSLLVPRSKALWTVVRLELQAIILSIPYIDQFVDAFKHNDKLPRIIICSDSLVNVQRLNSIREPSGDLNNWDKSNIHKARQLLKQRGYQLCHLKGTANPADPISRGLPVQLRCDTEPKYYDSTYLQKWIINVVDSTHSATAPPCTVTSTNVTSNDANDAEGDNTNNQDNPVVVSLPQVGYSVDVLKEAQHSDPHISAIIASLGNRQQLLNLRVQLKYYFLDSDGLLRYYPHHEKLPRLQTDCPVVIPSSGARALWSRLHEAHNHPGSGSGLRRLQRLVIWHRMPRDVRRWTSQCIICLRSRRERQARNTVNQFRIKSTRPLEVINIDYCGPYHGTSGSPVALVAVCAATGFVYGRLLPDRKLSTLIHYLFLLFNENGYPSILCCDRDSTILAAVNHLASWGITVATIPAYSVRLAWWERVHRQLHDHMRCYILNQQAALQQNGDPTPPPPTYADTEKALASSIMAINETPHGPGGLGVTPNMMVHSNGNAMLPNSLVLNDTNSDEASHYVKRLILTPITDETTVQQLRQGMALSLQQYLRLARLPDLKRHDGPTRYQVPIDHPSSRLKSGDPCFYWRPRAHKLSSSWLPATFIARLPDTNFAVLEKPSGQRITEYFFNVMCIRTSEELSTAASTTS